MDDERRQPEQSAADGQVSAKRVDWDVALDVTGGDQALLVEVLDAFQIETPQMIELIRQALAQRDAKLLHRAAHTAKNAFGNIGAQATSDLAFQLELIGKEAAFEQVPPLLERLETHMRQVEQEVEQYLRANRS